MISQQCVSDCAMSHETFALTLSCNERLHALLAQRQVRLRNVSRKSARFRISNSRTSDAAIITATAATAAGSGSGVRAVYKPRGPVPAGLTCDVAVELTPGQYEVSTSTIISENNFVMFHCLLHSIVLIHTAVQ
jgi:hypothetical protein